MLVYNVTVNIDDNVHEEWLQWMKSNHIPEVMKCGLFESSKILKVLANDEGNTYSIQYRCESESRLKDYFDNHAPRLQAEHTEKYTDKFVAFRTILEELS